MERRAYNNSLLRDHINAMLEHHIIAGVQREWQEGCALASGGFLAAGAEVFPGAAAASTMGTASSRMQVTMNTCKSAMNFMVMVSPNPCMRAGISWCIAARCGGYQPPDLSKKFNKGNRANKTIHIYECIRLSAFIPATKNVMKKGEPA